VRSMTRVLKLATDTLGLRLVATGLEPRADVVSLPERCGRPLLAASCRQLLEGLPGEEVGHEIVGILRANQDPETLTTWWRQMASRLTGIELTRWLGFGQHLGVLNQVPLQELAVVLDDPAERRNRVLYILQSEQMNLFDQHPLAAEDAVDTVLR